MERKLARLMTAGFLAGAEMLAAPALVPATAEGAKCSSTPLTSFEMSAGQEKHLKSEFVIVNGDGTLNSRVLFDAGVNSENTGSVGVAINPRVMDNDIFANYPLSVAGFRSCLTDTQKNALIGKRMREMDRQHSNNPNFSTSTVFASAK